MPKTTRSLKLSWWEDLKSENDVPNCEGIDVVRILYQIHYLDSLRQPRKTASLRLDPHPQHHIPKLLCISPQTLTVSHLLLFIRAHITESSPIPSSSWLVMSTARPTLPVNQRTPKLYSPTLQLQMLLLRPLLPLHDLSHLRTIPDHMISSTRTSLQNLIPQPILKVEIPLRA